MDPWSLCTITQAEELKALIKVLPIWSTAIPVAMTLNQRSFGVLQAKIMDRRFFISKFKIPPASFGVFGILSMATTVVFYVQVLVPLLSKFTKRKRGLSLKERMGIGIAILCLATAVSAIVERKRRNEAIRDGLSNYPANAVVMNMSAMWLVPQHCLTGIAEAFNYIGQIEFYYSQFPKTMSSIAMSLSAFGMGVGSLIAGLIVSIVKNVTQSEEGENWLSNNINKAHYDYYYWLLTIMGAVNIFYSIACSWAFGSCEDNEVDDMKEEDMPN
ncbi:hypothetical protein SO802_002562 [Lithocarpus litseifolius]|uniref:Uncharacterized protein n=1 Tax=Lithocarpus litseifolius TaxID=425828 RepID=A0AAW2E136_9ROSI